MRWQVKTKEFQKPPTVSIVENQPKNLRRERKKKEELIAVFTLACIKNTRFDQW